MKLAILLALGLSIVGCASNRDTTPSSEPGAKRIYTAGEARFAAGEPEQAVSLWRHAVTQLPPTPEYDALRHKLILRLAFGQMVAYQHSAKLSYLFDAKQMLDRYLVIHEGLFGTGDGAKAQRDQVYELLTEVERLIEDPPVEVAASSAVAYVDPAAAAPADTASEPAPVVDVPAVDGTLPRKSRRRRAREDAEGSERVVVVDTRKRTSVDDLEFRKKLRTWAPEAGLSLTAPSIEPWLPARSYVRLDGRALRLGEGEGGPTAQHLATDVLRAARPALRKCYDAAYARAPADYALATIELTVSEEGRVQTPRIVRGVVGDAEGDVCVLEGLQGAALASYQEGRTTTLAVPLMFFFDGPVSFDGSNGRDVRNDLDLMMNAMSPGGAHRRPTHDVPRNLPPITR